MSWESYRERTHTMDAVLEGVSASGGWRVPDQCQPEIAEMFGDEAGFAQALYPRWFAALTARLDAILEEHPADLPDAAARAAEDLARERPGLFALLAVHANDPALADAREQEERYLDWAPDAHLTALAARQDELLPAPGTSLSIVTVIRGRIRKLTPVLSGF